MLDVAAKALRLETGALYRVLPFALFMSFIAAEEGLRFAAGREWLALPECTLYYLYPVKSVAVGALLWTYRDRYDELRLKDLLSPGAVISLLTGIVTCVIWVSLDFSLAPPPEGFNPTLLPEGAVRFSMTAVRVAGAVIVVPVMEELFWRSFLLRYLVDPDFESVPLGSFTWGSFLATSVLFALEHHHLVAGVMAGAVYGVILYRTRSLAHCVLAHAATNLCLAVYVLYTGKWYFW